jgi:hypothetical protein
VARQGAIVRRGDGDDGQVGERGAAFSRATRARFLQIGAKSNRTLSKNVSREKRTGMIFPRDFVHHVSAEVS